MKKFILALFILLVYTKTIHAQDTLPNFTVRDLGKGKVQVSWINPFDKVVQLIVQRSFDSTGYFRSIFSSQSPWLPQNGFVDNNAPVGYKVYYRIQYILEGGAYFFTKSKSPTAYDNMKIERVSDDNTNDKDGKSNKGNDDKAVEKKKVKIYRSNKDSLVAEIDYKDYRRYRDSINKTTKDTIQKTEYDDEIVIKPFIPKPVWKASTNIFTNEKGFIRIILPLVKQYKYRINFFNEMNEEIFVIKHLKDGDLVLDKSNFKKVGWYYFELYENEVLKEKNKFYVDRDR